MDDRPRSYFFLFLCLSGLFSCVSTDAEDRPQVFTRDDAAVEVARTVDILYSDSAQVRVRIQAPVLLNITDRENPRQEFPESIRMEFMGPQGQISSTLTARTAFRYAEKGLVVVRDSVVLVTEKNEVLETEEMTWDERTRKIHTDKFVKISKPEEVIYGFGLEAEQDFSYWRILVPKGNIKAGGINKELE